MNTNKIKKYDALSYLNYKVKFVAPTEDGRGAIVVKDPSEPVWPFEFLTITVAWGMLDTRDSIQTSEAGIRVA